MNTPELKQLKMAWLAAREAGNTQEQIRLLHMHPEQQNDLIDFIAAYHATGGDISDDTIAGLSADVLPMTQNAFERALGRVFESQATFTTLSELRKSRKVSKAEAARGLRLGIDVWNKLESGAIELVSLSQRQLEHLSTFFQVSTEQFGNLLVASQPAVSFNRRQTRQAAQQQQGLQKQSFAEALERSTMSAEDKRFWAD